MSPLEDFLFRTVAAVIFLALVASVCLGRRRTDPVAVAHNPGNCRDCVRLRHPSNQDLRRGLEVLPRQVRRGQS